MAANTEQGNTKIGKAELPWIAKYRPSTLDDVIDHGEKIHALKNLVSRNQLPHLLFYGPPGSGKTSLILALAREIYGDETQKHMMEINASFERGIDTIRGTVVQFITKRSDKVKLVILDEADALTGDAQAALKSVIDGYSRQSRFCIICNDINKISPALQSRCVKMVFSALRPDAIKKKLMEIVSREEIHITDSAVDALILLEKDFRQILNILEIMKTYYEFRDIDEKDIYEYTGKPTQELIDNILRMLCNGSFAETTRYLMDLYKTNVINMVDLLTGLLQSILQLKIDVQKKHMLIETLATIDRNLRSGGSCEIQICLLVSAFIKMRAAA
jgi:replication factor C subunit 3/5